MKKLVVLHILVLSLFIGINAAPLDMQNDLELIKLSNYFGKYYQYADEAQMKESLANDFRYFTNVKCNYKNCDKGANKEDYIAGVIAERKNKGFTVEAITMKYIAPLENSSESEMERKVSFYTELITKASGKSYKLSSVIDYYFKKDNDNWKIIKIENRIIGK